MDEVFRLYEDLKLLQFDKLYLETKIEKVRESIKQAMLDAGEKSIKTTDGGNIVVKERKKTIFDEESAIQYCKETAIYEMFTRFNPTAFKKAYSGMFVEDAGVELEVAVTIPDRELNIF